MASVGTDPPDDYRARQAFAEHLTGYIISRFTGETSPRVVGDKPSRGMYFIATLMPRTNLKRRRPKRATPKEVGVEVLIPPSPPPEAFLEIAVPGASHYRVFPTFKEQLHTGTAAVTPEEEESEEQPDEEDRHAKVPPSESMLK